MPRHSIDSSSEGLDRLHRKLSRHLGTVLRSQELARDALRASLANDASKEQSERLPFLERPEPDCHDLLVGAAASVVHDWWQLPDNAEGRPDSPPSTEWSDDILDRASMCFELLYAAVDDEEVQSNDKLHMMGDENDDAVLDDLLASGGGGAGRTSSMKTVATVELDKPLGMGLTPDGTVLRTTPGGQGEANGVGVGAQVVSVDGVATSNLAELKAQLADLKRRGVRACTVVFFALPESMDPSSPAAVFDAEKGAEVVAKFAERAAAAKRIAWAGGLQEVAVAAAVHEMARAKHAGALVQAAAAVASNAELLRTPSSASGQLSAAAAAARYFRAQSNGRGTFLQLDGVDRLRGLLVVRVCRHMLQIAAVPVTTTTPLAESRSDSPVGVKTSFQSMESNESTNFDDDQNRSRQGDEDEDEDDRERRLSALHLKTGPPPPTPPRSYSYERRRSPSASGSRAEQGQAENSEAEADTGHEEDLEFETDDPEVEGFMSDEDGDRDEDGMDSMYINQQQQREDRGGGASVVPFEHDGQSDSEGYAFEEERRMDGGPPPRNPTRTFEGLSSSTTSYEVNNTMAVAMGAETPEESDSSDEKEEDGSTNEGEESRFAFSGDGRTQNRSDEDRQAQAPPPPPPPPPPTPTAPPPPERPRSGASESAPDTSTATTPHRNAAIASVASPSSSSSTLNYVPMTPAGAPPRTPASPRQAAAEQLCMELIDTGESLREKASAVQAQLLADEMNCDEDEVEGNAGVAIGGDASTKRRRRLQRNVTELLNESEKVYNEVLEVSPKNALAHYGLGAIHFARKEFSRAVSRYSISLEVLLDGRPESADHVNNTKPRRPASEQEQRLEARIRHELGLALHGQKRTAEALASLRRAAEVDPSLVEDAQFNQDLTVVFADFQDEENDEEENDDDDDEEEDDNDDDEEEGSRQENDMTNDGYVEESSDAVSDSDEPGKYEGSSRHQSGRVPPFRPAQRREVSPEGPQARDSPEQIESRDEDNSGEGETIQQQLRMQKQDRLETLRGEFERRANELRSSSNFIREPENNGEGDQDVDLQPQSFAAPLASETAQAEGASDRPEASEPTPDSTSTTVKQNNNASFSPSSISSSSTNNPEPPSAALPATPRWGEVYLLGGGEDDEHSEAPAWKEENKKSKSAEDSRRRWKRDTRLFLEETFGFVGCRDYVLHFHRDEEARISALRASYFSSSGKQQQQQQEQTKIPSDAETPQSSHATTSKRSDKIEVLTAIAPAPSSTHPHLGGTTRTKPPLILAFIDSGRRAVADMVETSALVSAGHHVILVVENVAAPSKDGGEGSSQQAIRLLDGSTVSRVEAAELNAARDALRRLAVQHTRPGGVPPSASASNSSSPEPSDIPQQPHQHSNAMTMLACNTVLVENMVQAQFMVIDLLSPATSPSSRADSAGKKLNDELMVLPSLTPYPQTPATPQSASSLFPYFHSVAAYYYYHTPPPHFPPYSYHMYPPPGASALQQQQQQHSYASVPVDGFSAPSSSLNEVVMRATEAALVNMQQRHDEELEKVMQEHETYLRVAAKSLQHEAMLKERRFFRGIPTSALWTTSEERLEMVVKERETAVFRATRDGYVRAVGAVWRGLCKLHCASAFAIWTRAMKLASLYQIVEELLKQHRKASAAARLAIACAVPLSLSVPSIASTALSSGSGIERRERIKRGFYLLRIHAAGSASIMKLKKSLLERHQQLTTSADAAATAARIQEAAVSQASAAAERVRKQMVQLEALAEDRDRYRAKTRALQGEVTEMSSELDDLHGKHAHLKRQLLALRHQQQTEALSIQQNTPPQQQLQTRQSSHAEKPASTPSRQQPLKQLKQQRIEQQQRQHRRKPS